MSFSLNGDDKANIRQASPIAIVNELSGFRDPNQSPWLPPTFPFPNGELPSGQAAFSNVSPTDMCKVIAVRGPLHAIDGWGYLGKALLSLMSGQPHIARHLSYYAELRAALSILASSGIGVFNRRNAIVNSTGDVTIIQDIPTHDMAWLALSEWSTTQLSMARLIQPLRLSGLPLTEVLDEFFPSQNRAVASNLMRELGFDLRRGADDRSERNWSSYQATALSPLATKPEEDAAFLRIFWEACRPNGTALERHLIRRVLETQARTHDMELFEYEHSFGRLNETTKQALPFNFLIREVDPSDHEFLIHVANTSLPAPPYAMICRAGLLLRLATGMSEENLRAAGVQPFLHFESWWHEFGANHGLWRPGSPLKIQQTCGMISISRWRILP